ncbi:MAG: peptidylprolyl isomerase [Burkholderiales bacterium]|nr:peptidylprolyl isomerase [Burkholderiales bacterium]
MTRLTRIALACLAVAAALPLQAQLRAPAQGGSPRLGTPQVAPGAAAAAPTTRQADYIVAVVNSEPVTNTEVRARAMRLQQQIAQGGGQVPGAQQLLGLAAELLVSERAQIQHARDIGIKVEDSAVDQAEQGIAAQNQLDVAELRRRLQADGLAVSQFREDLRNQILLQRLRERDFESRVRITDLEADQFLQEQRRQIDPERAQIDLAQILIAVPESATEAEVAQLQARAQRAYERARAGEDFAALARELSAGAEAAQGGRMGQRPVQRYPELFARTVQPLAVGGVAAPVRSGAGFHILKLLSREGGSAVATTVAESRARHILLRTGPQLTQAQAIDRLAEYKRRIQGGQADFAALAREHSQDGSAREGGDLGWTRPGQFVPEFEQVMNELAPGQISDPVVSRFGVHLIQLQERRDAALSEREQRELARRMLREKRLEETFENWARDIRARAYVEMREPPR